MVTYVCIGEQIRTHHSSGLMVQPQATSPASSFRNLWNSMICVPYIPLWIQFHLKIKTQMPLRITPISKQTLSQGLHDTCNKHAQFQRSLYTLLKRAALSHKQHLKHSGKSYGPPVRALIMKKFRQFLLNFDYFFNWVCDIYLRNLVNKNHSLQKRYLCRYLHNIYRKALQVLGMWVYFNYSNVRDPQSHLLSYYYKTTNFSCHHLDIPLLLVTAFTALPEKIHSFSGKLQFSKFMLCWNIPHGIFLCTFCSSAT